MSSPTGPNVPTTPVPVRTSRRWGVPMALVGGAAAVALLGGAALAGDGSVTTGAMQIVRGEHAGEHLEPSSDRAMLMRHRSEVDPEAHGERISELAQGLGVDAEELTDMLKAFRADREAMREELAELEPSARREAMRAFADARRAALAGILGVDADVLDELRSEAGHGHSGHDQAGPQRGRMGPHGRG